MRLVVILLLFGAALAAPTVKESEPDNVIDVYVVKNLPNHHLPGLPSRDPMTLLLDRVKNIPTTSKVTKIRYSMEMIFNPATPLSDIKVPQVVSSPDFEELKRSPVMIARAMTSGDEDESTYNDYAFYYCPEGLTCLEESSNFNNIKEAMMSGDYNKALYFYPKKDIVTHLFSGDEDVQKFVVPEDLNVQGVFDLSDYKIPFFLLRTPAEFNEAENKLPLDKVGQVFVSNEGVEMEPADDEHVMIPIMVPPTLMDRP